MGAGTTRSYRSARLPVTSSHRSSTVPLPRVVQYLLSVFTQNLRIPCVIMDLRATARSPSWSGRGEAADYAEVLQAALKRCQEIDNSSRAVRDVILAVRTSLQPARQRVSHLVVLPCPGLLSRSAARPCNLRTLRNTGEISSRFPSQFLSHFSRGLSSIRRLTVHRLSPSATSSHHFSLCLSLLLLSFPASPRFWSCKDRMISLPPQRPYGHGRRMKSTCESLKLRKKIISGVGEGS